MTLSNEPKLFKKACFHARVSVGVRRFGHRRDQKTSRSTVSTDAFDVDIRRAY